MDNIIGVQLFVEIRVALAKHQNTCNSPWQKVTNEAGRLTDKYRLECVDFFQSLVDKDRQDTFDEVLADALINSLPIGEKVDPPIGTTSQKEES